MQQKKHALWTNPYKMCFQNYLLLRCKIWEMEIDNPQRSIEFETISYKCSLFLMICKMW